jgi:hypothetical protein
MKIRKKKIYIYIKSSKTSGNVMFSSTLDTYFSSVFNIPLSFNAHISSYKSGNGSKIFNSASAGEIRMSIYNVPFQRYGHVLS